MCIVMLFAGRFTDRRIDEELDARRRTRFFVVLDSGNGGRARGFFL